MLHLIEAKWKGQPVVISDSKKDSPRGKVSYMKWIARANGSPRVEVGMRPLFPEDEQEWVEGGHSLVNGLMVIVFETETMKFTPLTKEGGYLNGEQSAQTIDDAINED